MKSRITNILLIGLVAILCTSAVSAAPLVAFQPDTLSVTPSGTFRTPPIVVTDATGISMVTIHIALPQEVSISTAVTSGNLTCVTKGAGVSGLFYSEWDPVGRKISITCTVNPSATIEVVRSIQFATSANVKTSQITLSGSATGGTSPALFGSLTVAPPHAINLISCTATPTTVESAGDAACSIEAEDSSEHAVSYMWSDGGRGGSFIPSSSSQAPTYRAPANNTGTTTTITLSCRITCTQNATATATATASLLVLTAPPKTIQVTSTPNPGASITFSPSPDITGKASAKLTPVTLTYQQTATGIQITAPKQDGATRPLWFDHWTLDGVDQTQGQLAITLNMASANHTLQAVYGPIVGDLNSDGRVDKIDAHIVQSAIMGDITTTTAMDVDQNGAVDIRDARWILVHRS